MSNTLQETDIKRWAAVEARDADADGRFVYAVRSTRIYCRPGCPSRRPHRENVSFFSTGLDAEKAGFRACLRCRPADGGARQPWIAAVCDAIAKSESALTLADLSAIAGLSPQHLQRSFSSAMGMSPRAYQSQVKRDRLQKALPGERRVDDAFYAAGYGSPSRVYEKSRELLGMTPARYRAGAPGEIIRHAFAKTGLGLLAVAATDRGICAMELGDDRAALLGSLRARFPKATLEPADAALKTLIERAVRLVDHPGEASLQRLELPLDVRGTAFQQRVWQALRRIPAGRTRTYTELAQAAGTPSGVRAVASACAANPVAVAIPCHRAIGADGKLHGYRWGLERKAELLRRESAAGKDLMRESAARKHPMLESGAPPLRREGAAPQRSRKKST